MSSPSRNNGSRIEREVAQKFRDMGFEAHRVDEKRGQLGKDKSTDVHVFLEGKDKPPTTIEIKGRKNGEGFSVLERWKGDNDLLILKRNHRQPAVFMDMDQLEKLLWPWGKS